MPEISDEDLATFKASAAKTDDLQSQLTKVLAKNDELLTETKNAKEKKRLADEQILLEQNDAAKKKGDFEQLHKSAMDENAKLKDSILSRDKKDASNAVNSAAMKLSITMADGDNAEMLSRFVADRLQFAEGEVKILDKDGQLTISTLDQLKEEFIGDARYSSLLKGNQSSGGGANGGGKGNGVAKTITRSDFDGKSHAERSKFFASGGTVID